MWSIVLMALGGLLIGGTYALYQQKVAKGWIIGCGACAAAALLAAWALTYNG